MGWSEGSNDSFSDVCEALVIIAESLGSVGTIEPCTHSEPIKHGDDLRVLGVVICQSKLPKRFRMTGSGPGNWYSIASIMMSHCQNKAHSGSKLVSNNFIILSHLQHSYQKATVLVKYSKESSL